MARVRRCARWDCIYEVPGGPAQAYHQVDPARCIGCQLCYRVPSESTGPWTMAICPWNAIDLIHNPCLPANDWPPLWVAFYAGDAKPDFDRLEQLGYQLFLNQLIYVKPETALAEQLAPFAEDVWSTDEGNGRFAILQRDHDTGPYTVYMCTDPGRAPHRPTVSQLCARLLGLEKGSGAAR